MAIRSDDLEQVRDIANPLAALADGSEPIARGVAPLIGELQQKVANAVELVSGGDNRAGSGGRFLFKQGEATPLRGAR
jgi:hypothetical protein